MLSSFLRRAVVVSRSRFGAPLSTPFLPPAVFSSFSSSFSSFSHSSSPSSPAILFPSAFPRLSPVLLADAAVARATAVPTPSKATKVAAAAERPLRKRRGVTTTSDLARADVLAAAREVARKKREDARAKKHKQAERVAAERLRRAEIRSRKSELSAKRAATLAAKKQERKDRIRERQRLRVAAVKADRDVSRAAAATIRDARPKQVGPAFTFFQKDYFPKTSGEGDTRSRFLACIAKWKSLSAAEREPYVKQREAASAAYQKALAAFKAKYDTRPRRPLSGYLRFSMSRVPALRAQTPGRLMKEYSQQVAGEWRALGEEERAKWNAQGKAELDAYNQAAEEWREKHSKTEQLIGTLAHRITRRFRESPSSPGTGAQRQAV